MLLTCGCQPWRRKMLGAAVGEAFGIAGLGAVQQVNAGASGERRYGFACAAAE